MGAGAAGAGFWYVQQQDASATTIEPLSRVDTVVVTAPVLLAPVASAPDSAVQTDSVGPAGAPVLDSSRACLPAPVS